VEREGGAREAGQEERNEKRALNTLKTPAAKLLYKKL
jgi:hypothetical protein